MNQSSSSPCCALWRYEASRRGAVCAVAVRMAAYNYRVTSMSWLPIRYREFYDIPRLFVIEQGGWFYCFECRFDDSLGEYPSSYRVYHLDPTLSAEIDADSWEGLASKGMFVGEVETHHVKFDETLRAAVDSSVIDLFRPLQSFVERVRLDNADRYYVWQSRLEFGHEDEDVVLMEPDGRMRTFSSEEEARAYGESRGAAFFRQTIIPFTNLDQLAAWCAEPRSETVDPQLFVAAWNLFADAGASAGIPNNVYPEPGWELADVAERLYFALNPTKAEEARPAFTREELDLLADVLCPGLSEFRARLVDGR
jgi:hypothetical protein